MKKIILTFAAGFLAGVLCFIVGSQVIIRAFMRGHEDGARRTRAVADLTTYAECCYRYHQAFAAWPDSLGALPENPRHMKFIELPDRDFGRDPWGQPIAYEPFDPARGDLALRSPGGNLEVRFGERGITRPWSQ